MLYIYIFFSKCLWRSNKCVSKKEILFFSYKIDWLLRVNPALHELRAVKFISAYKQLRLVSGGIGCTPIWNRNEIFTNNDFFINKSFGITNWNVIFWFLPELYFDELDLILFDLHDATSNRFIKNNIKLLLLSFQKYRQID